MSEFYTEQLVKRQTPAIYKAAKAGLIAVTAVVGAAGLLLIPLLLIPAALLAALDYWLFMRWDLEFEYLLINTDLDVDKIMSRNKRKKYQSFDLHKLEVMAPLRSHALDSYNQKQLKTIDISSGTGGQEVYVMILSQDQEMVKVIFEPNQQIRNGIKLIAPRKVVEC